MDQNKRDNDPLGWAATSNDPDVSAHLDNARKVADTLLAIDGLNDLDSLPEGAVCTLMSMLTQEIQKAEEVLENGNLFNEDGGAS